MFGDGSDSLGPGGAGTRGRDDENRRMSDETTILGELGKALAVSATLTAAAWGAFGGATAALAVQVDRKAVIRQILLGAMVSAGVGTLAMAFIVSVWQLPADLIPTGAGVGSANYVVGVFGPALIERLLRRVRGHSSPTDGDDKGEDGDNAA